MAFQIKGFGGKQTELSAVSQQKNRSKTDAPRKSLVKVRFPGKGVALAYYNDQFDLKLGDRVYVEGKLEGQQGRVVEISYNFKIKVSEYKKVIAVCDTSVNGRFFMADSYFVTFEPTVLPLEQATTWFKAPANEEAEIVTGTDDSGFLLDDLSEMNISKEIAQRGYDYYLENLVRYICLNGNRGYAIVQGGQAYVIEFHYQNGQISQLLCECPCCCRCKHEFAAMLQLKETLELIEKHYADEYTCSNYFAAITKGVFFSFVIDGKETGSFTL